MRWKAMWALWLLQRGKLMGSARFIVRVESVIGNRLGGAKRGRPESEASNRPVPGQFGLEF